MDNVRSLHNVGSFFRIADGAGIEKVILCGGTPTPPRHEISKTALGTVDTVIWEYAKDTVSALKNLSKSGYTLCAIEQTERSTDLYATKLPVKLAVVVGHERVGVSPEVLDLCPYHLHLPMRGSGAHSLNVSTCTSAVLYELGRRLCYD